MAAVHIHHLLRPTCILLILATLGAAAGTVAHAADEPSAVMPDPPIGPYQSMLFGRSQASAAGAGQVGTLPPMGYAPGIAPPQVVKMPKEPTSTRVSTDQFPPLERPAPQPGPSTAEEPALNTFPPLNNEQAAPRPSPSVDTQYPPAAETAPTGYPPNYSPNYSPGYSQAPYPAQPSANPYQAYGPSNPYAPPGRQYGYPAPGAGAPYQAQPYWFPGGRR